METAQAEGWIANTSSVFYGYFSSLRFFLPRCRSTKIEWFADSYDGTAATSAHGFDVSKGQLPSIVAHSFGTYILGYALLKYDRIRFDKVILCGSILPVDFPWDDLLAAGRVQSVRNEHSKNDIWAKVCRLLIGGSGPSGVSGFTRKHARLEQEEFAYDHSAYLTNGHFKAKWFPFLMKKPAITPFSKKTVGTIQWRHPWAYKIACFIAIVGIVAAMLLVSRFGVTAYWVRVFNNEFASACDLKRYDENPYEFAIVREPMTNAKFARLCHVLWQIGVRQLDLRQLPADAVSDDDIAQVADQLPTLTSLKLSECLEVKNAAPIGTLSSLHTLWIEGSKIESYKFLGNLDQLKSLRLVAPRLEVDSLQSLSSLTNLEISTHADRPYQFAWAKSLTHLTIKASEIPELRLTGATLLQSIQISDTKLPALTIKSLESLENVSLVDDPSLLTATILNCKSLTTLSSIRNDRLLQITVSGCQNINTLIADDCKSMQELSLPDCEPSRIALKACADGLQITLKNEQQIKAIESDGCFTEDDMKTIRFAE